MPPLDRWGSGGPEWGSGSPKATQPPGTCRPATWLAAQLMPGPSAHRIWLVCSSMASTALSTELSRDWIWLAVSFRRKRVTNRSTWLPPSYTCGGREGHRGRGADEASDTPTWGHALHPPRAPAGRQGLRTQSPRFGLQQKCSIHSIALRTGRQRVYKRLSTEAVTEQMPCERQPL